MNTVAMLAKLLLALALGLSCAAVPAQTSAPNRYAATIVAAERFEVDNLLVERHAPQPGSQRAPLVLIAGLASGPWVWQDLIARLGAGRAIYTVTLPGFDGRGALPGPQFDRSVAALRTLIASRKLDRPVIIGHSMGGALGIALLESAPTVARGLVSIDGLAVIPGAEGAPAAVRGQMAAAMKARMAGSTPAQFALQQQQYMRGTGVLDVAAADELAKLTARSDPVAVAAIMAEVVEHDLRPDLAKITAPVLLLAPYFQADAIQRGLTEAMVKDYYAALMAGTPKLTVTVIPESRHFVMFDQPQALADAVTEFLDAL